MINHLLHIAMGIHRGMRRQSNEDAIAYRYPSNYDVLLKRGVLVALADGVATSGRGADASQTAVTRLIDTYYTKPDYMDCTQALLESVRHINTEVHRLYDDGATTLVAAVIHESHAIIAHVGDSRAYWLHNNMLEQLTEDHVTVNELPDGTRKSKLTRAVGHHKMIEVDINEMNIHQGDTILLVTDGVTRYFNEADLLEFLQSSPADTVRDLILESNKAGGIDNIGAVVIQIGAELHNHIELSNHLSNIRQDIMVNIPDVLPEKKTLTKRFPLPFDVLQSNTTQSDSLVIYRRILLVGSAIFVLLVIMLIVYSLAMTMRG
jgi:protein phosphatase